MQVSPMQVSPMQVWSENFIVGIYQQPRNDWPIASLN
jgi:hypothetical protein